MKLKTEGREMSMAKFAKYKQLEQLKTFSENNKHYLNLSLGEVIVTQTAN